MLKVKLFVITLLSLLINSCENDENLFLIDTSILKQVYQLDEDISLAIKNDKNKTIDSITYSLNDSKIGTVKGNETLRFTLKNQKLGEQELKAIVFYNGKQLELLSNFILMSNIEPQLLKYKILNTYPHDIKAYTQGLEFYRDTLYEGTGNGAGNGTGIRGTSSLRKTNFKTGIVYKKIELAPVYFGEGITILNNKVYQLTYQNNEGYVYNADTFEKIKTFQYFKKMEGWGLTNDGEKLYMSDGSEKIYILNPETLEKIDYINVYTKTAKIESLNELEWIDNKIWANIYGRDALAVINPKNGAVEAVLNLSDLKSKVTQHPDIDVLNGIAYNPKTKTFFVTGKNWDKMFEITIIQ